MKTRCYLCKEVIIITAGRPKICTNCKTVLAYLARNSHQADLKLAELRATRRRMMESLKEVLMRRDNMTAQAAEELIQKAREDLHDKLSSEEYVDDTDFMADWFGLEPDYIMELL